MDSYRKLLYPLSAIYGLVVKLRNILYNKGFFSAKSFEIPTIVVGNLSVGGTGKTPMIEYLVRLLQSKYKIAILSRGYKRRTSGFILAGPSSKVLDIGDEPMQYHTKFKNVAIAVDANRQRGIQQLLKLDDKPQVVLLDDGFQHRKVKAGLNILLTSYNNLYVDDSLLPYGNLREGLKGAERAHIIVITKCPNVLDQHAQFKIAQKLKASVEQTVFFSKIKYGDHILNNNSKIKLEALKDYQLILVTGIANATPLLEFLNALGLNFKHKKFKDHHAFSQSEIDNLINNLDKIKQVKKLILTTEKDYIRIARPLNKRFFYLPIETAFINHGNDFDHQILNYVG